MNKSHISNIQKKYSLMLFILTLIQIKNITGMEGNSAPQDPLKRLDYCDAFDQSKIHEKYKLLMEHWGCNKNVFGTTHQINASLDDDEQDLPLLQEPNSNQVEIAKNELNDYEKECLKKLYAARRWAISEPARESLTLLLLMVAATGAINGLLDQESLGGSFSIFALIFNSIFLLRDTTRSAYQLAYQPVQPLDNLEKQFAKNQCFIPKAIWPAIIEKFMLARQNQFEQRQCMDFIKFALGLTTFKPQKQLSVELNSREIIATLHKNINAFFDDYEEPKNDQSSIDHNYRGFLKVNVAKFVLALLNNKNEQKKSPRYLYLHGPAGIGKTYFVQQLCSWIEQLMPNSAHFEDLVISSAEELEGSAQRPGALLCALRNQLMEHKKGSVIFMDEATWLNKEEMKSPSKRVFNGDQSKISTSYFGGGLEGSGIKLAIPPMLLLTAANDSITDEALKSRFDIVQWPSPKKAALVNYGLKLARESDILGNSKLPEGHELATWIEESKIKSFRQIEANLEQFVLSGKKSKNLIDPQIEE